MIEAGVHFVTVRLRPAEFDFDTHSENFPRLRTLLPAFDRALAGLIDRLQERDLLSSTAIMAAGEFGRTPKISTLSGQTTPGRDHWANAMSVLMAGGGIPGGVVVGATDRKGYSAIENVKSPENFVATVYSKLGIDPGKILYTPQGRPTHLVSDPTPIRELMG